MVLFHKGRTWRLLFAAIISCVFGSYCVFWRQTFAEVGPQADTHWPLLDSQESQAARDLLNLEQVEQTMLGATYPSRAPTYGYMTSGFGWRKSPFDGESVLHRGVDFAVPYGSDIFATADGVVAFAGWSSGLGRTVELDHGRGIVTRYAHTSSILVAEGDLVRKGDVIAKVGNSGRSTGPHLHYEVCIDGSPVDPAPFLTPEVEPEQPVTLLASRDKRMIPMGVGRGTFLGLGMGGEALASKTAQAVALARNTTKHLFKFNLAVVAVFSAVALAMTLRLLLDERVQLSLKNSGKKL